ncbi:cation:proton antiporter [Flavobacterium sp. NRK F10]|uniref:cation:proton antiporter n=1 Tax=Flavobacterium sp. NRK F10 TaxID=2954931 RepID=UPI0020905471|nr:cation:proton antiporter [Flavobacterium sp. NRK F10]MCO6173493.1 cation:proton antiporter [Flavobacterium sp. NRK F10]
MNFAIIITICVLLLLAYLFTITSSKTKIPSVILLLLLGWVVKQATEVIHLVTPDLEPLLEFFGTIGLVLIVLEGSLELDLNKRKLPFVAKTVVTAILPLIITAFVIGHFFYYFLDATYKEGLINAIPLCIISSAIAISSVGNLGVFNKEFAIYESSLSDILGVLFFNFLALNTVINLETLGNFTLEVFLMLLISFIATAFLAFLLSRIDHHVKFAPIILLIILIFAISEIYHLPALIFIMLFGLFLGNFDELDRFKFIQKLKPRTLNREVVKFKELIGEAAFLVRSLFFLLFGFLMKTEDILNPNTLELALGIVALIYLVRAIQLKVFKVKLMPLLFIAPRGLITILLFLKIPLESKIPLVNKALIIQVIVLSALVMMIGLIFDKKDKVQVEEEPVDEEKSEVLP